LSVRQWKAIARFRQSRWQRESVFQGSKRLYNGIQRRRAQLKAMRTDSRFPSVGAGIVLALLRIALGVFFGSTFFENLGKQLYTSAGYASLIQYYIKYGHAPAVWKAVMGYTAASAAIAAPLQGILEAGLGVFLVIGLLARPAAFVAFVFLTGLWVSEWGLGWIWELLVPMIVAASLALGPSGEYLAVDVALARRWPQLVIW
jgi:uncharacterized membrane protein YphA (DoxX/SURF4 family)